MNFVDTSAVVPLIGLPLRAWPVGAEAVALPPEAEQAWLAASLSNFTPIDLAQMNSVALLDRSELKYVMHLDTLAALIDGLSDSYAVLEVNGHRLNRYRSLYFDTPDFAMYHRHHMGARNRYKLRAREYVESRTRFLEVKHKTSKRRTVKHRIATPELVTQLADDVAGFVNETCPYPIEQLLPRLWSSYFRITLVNRHMPERVTLDIDLSYWHETCISLAGLVIAEVKLQGNPRTSQFVSLMHANHTRPNGFSKYCVGMSLLYPELKQNKFKVKQRLVARLLQGGQHDVF